MIIDQLAVVTLKLARFNEQIISGEITPEDEERYRTLLSLQCRLVQTLGTTPAVNHASSLGERIGLKGDHQRQRNGSPPNNMSDGITVTVGKPIDVPRSGRPKPLNDPLRSSISDAIREQLGLAGKPEAGE